MCRKLVEAWCNGCQRKVPAIIDDQHWSDRELHHKAKAERVCNPCLSLRERNPAALTSAQPSPLQRAQEERDAAVVAREEAERQLSVKDAECERLREELQKADKLFTALTARADAAAVVDHIPSLLALVRSRDAALLQ